MSTEYAFAGEYEDVSSSLSIDVLSQFDSVCAPADMHRQNLENLKKLSIVERFQLIFGIYEPLRSWLDHPNKPNWPLEGIISIDTFQRLTQRHQQYQLILEFSRCMPLWQVLELRMDDVISEYDVFGSAAWFRGWCFQRTRPIPFSLLTTAQHYLARVMTKYPGYLFETDGRRTTLDDLRQAICTARSETTTT